jgi:magnesium transporter
MRIRLRDRWRQYLGEETDHVGVRVSDLARTARPGVITCAVYSAGRRVDGDVALDGAAGRRHEGFVWIELHEPNADDIAAVAAEFNLPQLAVANAVAEHQRPKLDIHGDVAFVVLKPVHYVDREEVIEVTQIAIVLGPGFIATVRHGDTEVLDQVRQDLDAGLKHPDWGPTEVASRVADRVIDGYQKAIDFILEDVDEIEEQVFGGGDDDRSERIYKLKREVAEFRRAVSPLGRTLERISGDGESRMPAVHPGAAPYFRGMHERLIRAVEGVEAVDRLLTDVFQANVAQVSTRQTQIALRQNEDMRKISAWAAIALVPTAVAGIYGMNFEHMPELRWRLGYPLALAVIVGICVALHRNFRRKHWL